MAGIARTQATNSTDGFLKLTKTTPQVMQGDLVVPDVVKIRNATFSYNADGSINQVIKTGGRTSTFTYNADGSINTINDGTYTKTFSYNADGSLNTIIVT